MQEWIEVLLRSISLFFLTLILVRSMGKRNISRLPPFNYVNYIVIAILASLISVKVIQNIVLGFIALGTWILLAILVDYLAMKSKWVHDWVNGKETILIKQGKIMEENLAQSRLTGEELLRNMRAKNAFSLSDVEFAVLESTGDVNVLLKSDKQPVTSHALGQKVAPRTEPQTVILDGNIINEPLAALGLNKEWLKTQLEIAGISPDNVFIGQVDSSGELYLDLFDDSIQIPQPKVKEILYANLEKSHADLMSFALETEDQKAKKMYFEHAHKLEQVMKKLQPILLH